MQACAARGTASRMMSKAERRRSLLLTMLTWAGLAGNYSDEAGAAFCHPCPAGKHQGGADAIDDIGLVRAPRRRLLLTMDGYVGWQAPTRTRQGLASAIPVRQVSSREGADTIGDRGLVRASAAFVVDDGYA